MAEINLYAGKLEKLKKKQRLKQFTWKSILTVLLGLAVVLIILSGFSLIIARNNQSLTSKIATQKNQIENLRPVESKQVYL